MTHNHATHQSGAFRNQPPTLSNYQHQHSKAEYRLARMLADNAILFVMSDTEALPAKLIAQRARAHFKTFAIDGTYVTGLWRRGKITQSGCCKTGFLYTRPKDAKFANPTQNIMITPGVDHIQPAPHPGPVPLPDQTHVQERLAAGDASPEPLGSTGVSMKDLHGVQGLTDREYVKTLQAEVNAFYKRLFHLGVGGRFHAFLEWAGVMAEHLNITDDLLAGGHDAFHLNRHTAKSLPVRDFRIGYLSEKLQCIFEGVLDIYPHYRPSHTPAVHTGQTSIYAPDNKAATLLEIGLQGHEDPAALYRWASVYNFDTTDGGRIETLPIFLFVLRREREPDPEKRKGDYKRRPYRLYMDGKPCTGGQWHWSKEQAAHHANSIIQAYAAHRRELIYAEQQAALIAAGKAAYLSEHDAEEHH